MVFRLRLIGDGGTQKNQIERAGVTAQTTLKKVGTFVSLGGPSPQATQTKAAHWPGEEPGR